MICLVDYRNLKGRSKVMRSTCLRDDVEYNSSMRDACISIISSPRSSMVVFCLDGSPNFRLSILPEYKGTRKKEEPDPHALPVYPESFLVEDLRQASQMYNTPVYFACSPHREADDVIASIVRGVNESSTEDLSEDYRLDFYRGLGAWTKLVLSFTEACIMSSDTDLQQLIVNTDSLKVSMVSKMSLIDKTFDISPSFKKKDVFTPSELLAYKILEGDSGDNIPRSRIMPPRKVGNLFWKTLNSEEKLMSYVRQPDLFPELDGFVDIEKMRLNTRLIFLSQEAYPLSTPYFYKL